ncbi:E3 ubiquitin protein ligase RIN2-like [Zingiber officinale]|uniref:E3 ubiquitin protein ligase RIN2-like n=1 Tax=Zingiber officinale TaxID=94328 RepID=UPI001C4CE77E|nr:E3 ubiquitin protein ligase RIN2-like [Zingiber officinale]
MAVNYLYLSAFSTTAGLVALQWWTGFSLDGMTRDGLIGGEGGGDPSESAGSDLVLLLSSRVTVALLVNFVINVYILAVLLLKLLFFVQLTASETRKVLERFINYIMYKGAFLPLVVPLKISHVIFWSTWLIFLCSLKIFQSVARDRLERLNASPSMTPLKYFRVYSSLLLVLFADFIWMKLCMVLCSSYSSSLLMLLFFEPLSVAFDTLQVIMIHGFQLAEIYQRHSSGNASLNFDIQKTTAGSLSEWKGLILRHCGFILDMMTLVMSLGHYLMTWWLHGMAFHLVDIALFLNLRALVSAVATRIKAYLKLRKALTSLDGVLPDATYEELCAYNDKCAICREPMARAKKLSCNHLFHLVCLRSWLDQGLTEGYSCPTCRRPLFVPNAQDGSRSASATGTDGNQLVEHLNLGLNQARVPVHALPLGASPNQRQNTSDTIWRSAAFNPNLTPPWVNQGMDGASSSSSVRSVGFEGVQMMMRQLTSVSDNFAHSSLDNAAWNLWPSQHPASPIVPASSSIRPTRNTTDLRIRRAPSSPVNNSMPELLAMVDRVREVLPHIPDELIVQDLLRTNNINITVNNLLVQ